MDHFSQRVLERYNVNINRNHKRKINLSIQGKNKLYKVIFWRKVTNRITLWLVNTLTALMRPFLVGDEGFPGFSTNAPMASSGKTALLGTAWMLAHGHRPRVESWAGDEDETAKHLLALAMEGRGCVLWDNLPESKGFDSARVASYMTAETVGGRLLGQTKTASGVAGVMMLYRQRHPAGR